MIRILLTDDDARIRTIVREYAQAEDWAFTEAGDGRKRCKSLLPARFRWSCWM